MGYGKIAHWLEQSFLLKDRREDAVLLLQAVLDKSYPCCERCQVVMWNVFVMTLDIIVKIGEILIRLWMVCIVEALNKEK